MKKITPFRKIFTFHPLPYFYMLFMGACGGYSPAFAQSEVNDQSIRYQEQRMVYQQWDQNKFTPKKGFLSLNPYYWLVWGLFYPNYHKNDLRPLSPAGPQTRRLALVAVQENIVGNYKLAADTIRNTAMSQLAVQSGLLAETDPLWQLYYSRQFQPLLNYSQAGILGPLPPEVSGKLVNEGMFTWYINELAMLRERLMGARTTDMDRGSRILSYSRMLKEYRKLAGIWNHRIVSAQKNLEMAAQQKRLRDGQVNQRGWSPETDIRIANKVLVHIIY